MIAKGRLVLLCALFLVGVTSPLALGQGAIPLEQAVKDGKVEVEVKGIGGSTGDAILIIARRKVPEVLRLTLTAGTVFKSTSGTVQNMVGACIKGERVGDNSYRPTTEIVLADNEKHSYVIEAFCLDFHKPNPGSSDAFTIAPVNEPAAKILQAGKAKTASIAAIQSALWMDKEGVTVVELKERFPVLEADIVAARELLAPVSLEKPKQDSGSNEGGVPLAHPFWANAKGDYIAPRLRLKGNHDAYMTMPEAQFRANWQHVDYRFPGEVKSANEVTVAGRKYEAGQMVYRAKCRWHRDDTQTRGGVRCCRVDSVAVEVSALGKALGYEDGEAVGPSYWAEWKPSGDDSPRFVAPFRRGDSTPGSAEKTSPSTDVTPRKSKQQGAFRTWIDPTGTYKVEAQFVDFKDENVALKKKDGTVISVPLKKLSAMDQEYAKLQGGWKVASCVANGVSLAQTEGNIWTFKGATVTRTVTRGVNKKEEVTFQVDPAKSPKQFDQVVVENEKATIFKGIY